MKILLSAFEPFDGLEVNPSFELLKMYENSSDFQTCVLPVCFKNAYEKLKKTQDEFQAEAILCLGLANKRSRITIERVAINWVEARIPDNSGYKPEAGFIYPNEDKAYFSTLPIYEMANATQSFSHPATISNTAGTYVCNYVMYRLLRDNYNLETKAGFVHVPGIKETNENVALMSLEELKQQLDCLLLAIKNPQHFSSLDGSYGAES